jgi:predicted nuclease of restriction endonuclease-like (RecB) superfamily
MKHKKTIIPTQNFTEVLNLIVTSKQNVYKKINTALIELYWEIGKYISLKTTKENWGKSIVKELASFITQKEPTIKGFTSRGLWRMKQFYEIYKDSKKVSPLVTQITWTNHLLIISASKSDEEREYYIIQTINERYSYRELQRQINSGLFERTMIANKKLSPMVKALPQDTTNSFRDSYTFEFLGLPKQHSEKTLQQGLITAFKDFILEVGKDFCFIGQEYRIQVGDDDFKIDLLFYHRALQCLVAFELKIGKFKPSYLGQLEFYLEALDRDIKKDYENPSIGVLLCRKKNDEVVEYALNRSLSPTVVSDYETKLIPKRVLQDKLNELYEQYNINNKDILI